MIKKKICLLGYFAVGKTSLVRRFVHQTFSEKYHTTIGVKIDKKELSLDGEAIQLLIWDIHGEDKFQKVQKSYLIGSSAYFLVVDATRKDSLKAALDLKVMVEEVVGSIPYLALINKTDLVNEVEVRGEDLIKEGIDADLIFETSAKSGTGVELAFEKLAKMSK